MKQANKHTTSLLLASLISTSASAAVNMKDASFTKSFSDFQELQRTYSSRSLHDGVFGFGWCSAFEKKLEFSANGEVILKDCMQTTETLYKNSVSSDGELLKFTDSKYIVRGKDQKMIFNKNGELITLRFNDGPSFDLTYDQSGFLRKITSSKKSILRLNYDYRIRKVLEVISNREKSVQYKYQEKNLIQAIQTKSENHNYKYDKLHNLIEIRYPDLSAELLTYNTATDRVLTFRDRSGCIDTYQYAQKENYMSSTLEKLCSQRITSRVQFEFFEKIRSDGLTYLDKLKISNGTLTKEITYDAFSGTAKKITQKNAIRMAASKGSYE